jgi:HEAT repeat protein
MQPLLDLLEKEKEVKVRQAIVMSLSLLGNKEALPTLLDILKNEPDVDTRRNAAGGLRFFRGEIDAKEIYNLFLGEKNPEIRKVLSSTLAFLREKEILSEMITLFKQSKKDKELQECLLEIIGNYDMQESKELLIDCVSPDCREEIRYIATRAMARLDDIKFIPHLYEVYNNDACKEISEYAFKVLEELSVVLNYSSVDQMVLDVMKQLGEKEQPFDEEQED